MIIITGASDGVGLELAKLYKNEGKEVTNISRRQCPYATRNLICNLENNKEIEKVASEILTVDDKIEAFINAAGVYSYQEIGSITRSEVDKTFAVNIKAPIMLTTLLFKRIKSDGADVVNISSTVGIKSRVGQAVYSTTKWALRGYSKSLQLELNDSDSRVISYCPGGIKTKLFEKATGVDKTSDGTRWMDPKDIAGHIKQILELPKSMEVSEIIVDRKK